MKAPRIILMALASVSLLFGGDLFAAQGEQQAIAPEMVKVPGRNFEIGKYEVTQGQWRAVMGSDPVKLSSCGDNCPVEQVSWRDTQEFIDKLNSKTGKKYRLPMGDEWEYACYGGKKSKYCGGDNIDELAWSNRNSEGKIHPVGQKQPNGYGLYDMSGNVDEWTDVCVEGDCAMRELRGGAWDDEPQFVLVPFRDRFIIEGRDEGHGFRLVRTLP